MEFPDLLARQIADELDDVLASAVLVAGDRTLEDRVYARLVDLLVEAVFVDARQRYLAGDIDRAALVEEIAALARSCRTAGLLPLSERGR
jgi:hypothetical protein